MKKPWDALMHWASPEKMRQHEDKVFLVLTLMIGATVGLVVVAFIVLTENLGARMYPAGGAAWRRVLVPVAGALVTGYLLMRYFPNARGSGIPQTKTALFLQDGVISFRTVLGKFGCSSVSLASGIALGREGPSVQVGAGIASTLGRQLGLSAAAIRSLVPIGAAAALAAAFNTPIAAVLFTLEEIMGDLHARVLGAIVLSSATSWIVLHLLLGDEPLFHVPAYQLVNPLEFGIYAVLGIAGGLVSVCFVKLLLLLRKYFLRMPSRTQWIQPVAGGLAVGIMGWVVPEVLGVGYGHVSQALNGQMAIKVMALLVALKLVATAACYASGNAGGIFGPSLFIGAMLGGTIGSGAHMLLPDYTGSVGAYALVGMGTTFAGIIRVPMTSVIMIFEITRDYSIIVPLMISNLISYLISSRLQKKPIYEALMVQDGFNLPATARDRDEFLPVRLGMRPAEVLLPAEAEINYVMASEPKNRTAWPVADEQGFRGVVSRAQLEAAIKEGHGSLKLSDILAVSDPEMQKDQFLYVHPDQPLDTAMKLMARSGLSVLPVVDRINVRKLIGLVSWNDALDVFKRDSTEIVEDSKPEPRTHVARIMGILAVVCVMIALVGVLTYSYRSQRSARAEQYLHEGNVFLEAQRYPEAIERFRSALSISHSERDRLSLALTLLKAERMDEAEIYLKELLQKDPNNARANLGLAQVYIRQGNVQDGIEAFHRAIYGSWPENRQENRLRARIELVDALGKSGRRKQAQAELLAALGEIPMDETLMQQVGTRLLQYDMPKEAVEIYKKIIQQNPRNGDAYAGLGEAAFDVGDYRSAEEALKSALLWMPGDVSSQKRLRQVEQILILDPNLRGLQAVDRYQRSRKLLDDVLGAMNQCLSASGRSPSGTVIENANAARKLLRYRGKPHSYSEATETNLELCERIWKARIDTCGPVRAQDETLGTLMSRISR